jgi:oligopeptide transport system substrate-binding protein
VNDRQVFEANPRWRDAAAVKLRKFVWLAGSNIATAFREYESGTCHWVFQAPTERMPELAKRPDCLRGPVNTSYFYVFNVTVKPLDDVRVRRALSLAVDRRTICEKVLQGGETPAERLTPMLYPGYEVK